MIQAIAHGGRLVGASRISWIARLLQHNGAVFMVRREGTKSPAWSRPMRSKQIDPAQDRPYVTLHDIMRPLEDLHSVTPDATLSSALESMSRYDLNQLPVIANQHLEGILSRAQVQLRKNSRRCEAPMRGQSDSQCGNALIPGMIHCLR